MQHSGAEIDLDLIGAIEGTDKCSSVASRWDYLRHYQRIFAPFQHQEINLIEIGIADGSSLKTWKAFFSKARIVGVDIMPECARFADDRTIIEIGSQDDPGFLARLCQRHPPTIIIDDGSHRADHVIFTFERLFPTLLAGGIYVAEDLELHTGRGSVNWKGLGDYSPPDYFQTLARSCLARAVPSDVDWGIARYTFQNVDSMEFLHGAVVLRKTAPRDVPKALESADRYLAGRPFDARVSERLCQFILQHGGPLERAEAELSRALEVGGENPRLLHGLAQVRERQGRMGEAAALAHRAASLGKDAGLWLFAGQLSTREGNFGAAAEAFGKAAGLTHDNPLFLLEWSLALERNKQLVEALESAQAGLRAATGTAVEQRLQARVTELMERRN
jgi:hypothetical protein